MNFKYLYTKNNIEYDCKKLYGPFPYIDNYNYATNKKGMKVIIPNINHSYKEDFYAEVDENEFFYDVIYYGKILYTILKSEIMPLKKSWVIPNSFESSIIKLISEESINNHFNKIEDICTEFLNKYTYCFVPQQYFPVNYKINQGIPLFPLINHILLIYMLHTTFKLLSTGYKSNKEMYESLTIKSDTSDFDIINILTDYINIYSLPHYHITSFHFEILKIDNNTVPITITHNLFSFAFEVLQNNIATRSFYSPGKDKDVYSYVGFKKCARCLKNIVDLDMDRKNFLSTPKYKKIYCDDCKRELKKIASNKYEHTLRELYDELKNNEDRCNPKLANEIRNLRPKDKETKSNLQRLYNEYQNDINKKE